MSQELDRRLAGLILSGEGFTADDLTEVGQVTASGDHLPNASQNAIGSVFRVASNKRRIVFTGEVRRSKSPHRKGGMIRVWKGTTIGRKWAEAVMSS